MCYSFIHVNTSLKSFYNINKKMIKTFLNWTLYIFGLKATVVITN